MNLEEIIQWRISLKNTISALRITSSEAKYRLTERMFKIIALAKCQSTKTRLDSAGQSYDFTFTAWSKKRLQENDFLMEKLYIENHLKFNQTIFKFNNFWERFQELNAYLMHFPDSTTRTPLTDDELRKLFMRCIPDEWHLKNELNVRPYELSLVDLLQRYTAIKTKIEMESRLKTEPSEDDEKKGENHQTYSQNNSQRGKKK